MANDKQLRRAIALTTWASAAGSVGFDVPASEEIHRIAENPDSWRTQSPSVAALDWANTIAHIVHQIKFGMDPNEVIRHLPGELRVPVSGPAKPRKEVVEPEHAPAVVKDPEPDAEPATPFEALTSWRARRIAQGADAAETIKDITFRNLVKYRQSSADQVRTQLRGDAAALAPEIAGILERFLGPAEAEQEPSQPQPRTREPQPVAAAATPVRTVDGLDELGTEDFVEYGYGDTDVERARISISKASDGYDVSWPALSGPDGEITLYRVVTGEGFAPHKPEAGELVGVVENTSWHDGKFFTSAVRHYQIWAHRGRNVEHARQQQPVCVADGEIVSPVNEFSLSEDEGRVIGQWTAWTGTNAVRIYRIPLDAGPPNFNDPRNEISNGQPNLTGFVDTGVERGARYLYQVKSEVAVGQSVRLSQPAQGEILVSVVLTSVSDLAITTESSSKRPEFDLAWSNPASGLVRVYRTESPPPAGLQDAELDVEALEPQGLTTVTMLKHPAVAGEHNTSRMIGVPWPSGWDRAYLTPVTVMGGHARVGATMVQTRPIDPVSDPKIIERCNKQIVTFGWPRSAASVCAYIGPRGLPMDEVSMSSPVEEISSAQYKRDGGLTFRQTLPANGCSIHLVPVAFSRGDRILGQPVTVEYDGLLRMNYALQRSENDSVTIFVRSELELDNPPALVLVSNPDRLPLSARDGRSLTLVSDSDRRPAMQCVLSRLGPTSGDSGWKADVSGLTGYVRMFVDLDSTYATSRTYALQDPPAVQLRVTPVAGPPR